MSKIFIAFLLLIGSCSVTKVNTGNNFDGYITKEFLQQHLGVIAGAEMEGRNTPSPGLERAAQYIEKQFADWGLKQADALHSYRQWYPLYKDSLLEGTAVTLNNEVLKSGTDFVFPLQANTEANSVQANNIQFVGYGIEDKGYNDYEGKNVTGAVVVLVLGEPKVDGIFLANGSAKEGAWTFRGLDKKLTLAKSKGAKAVLVVNPAQAIFTEKYTADNRISNFYYPRKEEPTLLHAVISQSTLEKLLPGKAATIFSKGIAGASFTKDDYAEKSTGLSLAFKKAKVMENVSNVVGVVEGSDKKDEYVVLTAHYDHLGVRDGKIYYGADDDGSGTVAVMAMAKAFAEAKKAGKGPRRTMIFMLVSGEEKGLWGSRFYSEHPAFPLEKTSVNLNIDMIGRIDTERILADTMNYVYVVGSDKLSSDLRPAVDNANNTITKLTLDFKFDDPKDPNRIYFRSDHYNFARKGVPVMFFYDGMLKADYHKPTDTVDKIAWDLYRKRALLVYHLAWDMANRNDMLKRDKPLGDVGVR